MRRFSLWAFKGDAPSPCHPLILSSPHPSPCHPLILSSPHPSPRHPLILSSPHPVIPPRRTIYNYTPPPTSPPGGAAHPKDSARLGL
jgi:hypothetical protein